MLQLIMKQFILLLVCLSVGLLACQEPKPEPILVHAGPADFEEEKQVSPTLADGLQLTLWAPGPLLKNAVALTFDQNGVAYVAETNRRKSSDIDIREHRDWITDDLALQNLDDTREFHRRKLAPELSDQNLWMEDFNGDSSHDYRDLEVQSEVIQRIWDSDGDGRADVAQQYADGFNDMIAGVAAGILSYEDQIYLTCAPDVWQLTDKDQDGMADERKKISHGFGIHIGYAGHDMSGLTLGPDGKIYWSIGDLGVNATGPDGRQWSYPNEGAVMRANPDGSDFEVFAHGLRNPQELAFDNFGNLISVDNDGDHPGEHERYVHIVEGSDSGWRTHWQFGKYANPNEEYKVWMDEQLHIPYFKGQASYITPPLALAYDGPAGLAFNPGTALGEAWNEHFFASFFAASSARSKVQAFTISPKGSSFSIDSIRDVVGGIVPTGITFAPDGALYINDWKDSYDKKPAGRIWKLDTQAGQENKERANTQALLKKGATGTSVEELATLMEHADQRVRLMAQFELAKRGESATLTSIANANQYLLARVHAIWGLGQVAHQNPEVLADILPLLKDEAEQVRAQTAKVMGTAKYQPALNELISQLGDESPVAQFFAAEALGKLGDGAAFQALAGLLERMDNSDTHLRHAVVFALSKLGKDEALADLSSHTALQVRLGAVVALRHNRSPLVARFLADADPLVLAEAARAINDDLTIPEAMPALAKALAREEIQNEAFVRRAINANLRLGGAENAARLVSYARSAKAPKAMKEDALWALGYWAEPPVLDRVDGRFVGKAAGRQVQEAQTALAQTFSAALAQTDPDLQAAWVTAAGRLQYQAAEPQVYALFQKTGAAGLKQACLSALSQMESPNIASALDVALLDKSAAVRQEAQELLHTVKLPENVLMAKYEKILNNSTVPEQQQALASIGQIDSPAAASLLDKLWQKFVDQSLDPALQLELMTAIDNSSAAELKAKKKSYEDALDPADVLAKYQPALYGGDSQRGQRVFARNQSAQCLRCHVLNGNGGAVGPELTHIASQLDRKELLLALVAPNDRIAPGYGTILLKLKDGKEVAGILEEETEADVKVKVGNEPVRSIGKDHIQERELLPSGMLNMGELLDKAQIRDVVAFLAELK